LITKKITLRGFRQFSEIEKQFNKSYKMIDFLKIFKKEKSVHRELKVGDKIELSGGYDYEIKYLQDPPANSRFGTVIKFIRNHRRYEDYSVVVKLTEPIIANSITGDILVLSTRYERQMWIYTGIVHLELCEKIPEAKVENERFGEWIEAAASYIIIN